MYPGLQPSRRPSTSCSIKPWVRKDSNLRWSRGDSRSTVWRNRRSATHPREIHRLVRESNPFQHLDRVPCVRYTNETHSHTHRASRGIEPSPRHSQCRVLPLHQTRQHTSARSQLASVASVAPHVHAGLVHPKRKRRDSNPHRQQRRPRLANACDETDIRLSSNHAPARNRTWNSSFARSRGLHSTTGTRQASSRYSLLTPRFSFTCLRQDSNPERSVRSAA